MVNVATSWSFCHGRRTAITRGGAAFGDLAGVTDAYGYNLRSEVVSSRRTLADSPVRGFDYDYAYDPIGNRTSATDYDEQGNPLVSSYSANALNQYTHRTVPGYATIRGEAATNATITVNERPTFRQGAYFYGGDSADNSTSNLWKELEVYAAINPSGTNTPDIVSATTGTVFIVKTPEQFTYDADGNMTSDGRFHYYWNGENRLVMASNDTVIVTYAYDHRGRMVRKEISHRGTEARRIEYLWDDWNIIRETTIDNCQTVKPSNCQTDYVWGLDLDGTLQGAGGVGGLLAVVRHNSSTPNSSTHQLYFPTYDANGNVSEYVSTNGEIVAHYDYSPFGEPLVATGPLAATFMHQFSTKPYCSVTGFSEYQMRKYRPEIGRWMSRDPMEEEGGLNLFQHCFNASVFIFDFLGYDNWGSVPPWGGGNQNAPPYSVISPPPYVPIKTDLEIDREVLFRALRSMCPDNSKMTAWGTICCVDDCEREALNIANAIFEVVRKNQTLFEGWFGNCIWSLTFGHCGHTCIEWRNLVLQGYEEGVRRSGQNIPKCFLGAGVGKFYPFTEWTIHNWVEIFGPYLKIQPWKDFIVEPGIHIDPWPTGGKRLFPGKYRPVHGIIVLPYL